MKQARFPYPNQGRDSLRQIMSIGKRRHLVTHHTEIRPLATKPDHRVDEVPRGTNAANPKQSRRSDNQVTVVPRNKLLSLQLRLTVRVQRINPIRFTIRLRLTSVEHIVRADLDDRRPKAITCIDQIFHALNVHHTTPFRFSLGKINLGEGSCVDHHVRTMHFEGRPDDAAIRDVEFWQVQADRMFAEQTYQLTAQLSPGTRNKNTLMRCFRIHNDSVKQVGAVGTILMTNLIDRFAATFPGIKPVRSIEHQGRDTAFIPITVNHSRRNQNDGRIGCSHHKFRSIPASRRVRTRVPGKQSQISRPKTSEQVRLLAMFVRPAAHAGERLTDIRHFRLESFRQLIAAK